MRFAMTLDPHSDLPLHRQIYDEWRAGILTGRFRGGERVPSTRELASVLDVARSTVMAAYDQLIAEGYLESAHGSGTYVCRQLPDDLLRARRVPVLRTVPEPAIRLAADAAEPADPLFCAPDARAGWLMFARWRPDLASFPFPLWRRLLNQHLRSRASFLFDYADSSSGYEPLRAEIAAYVSRSRAVRCTPGQVLIVNGSQQALDLCARLLVDPGDQVAIENPGYQGARQILKGRGARIHPVRVDSEGIVAAEIAKGTRAVYVTPSHQFPSGVSMTVARRLELIEWARRADAAIIEDDYDSEYRYSGPPLPAMQGLAPDAPVVYIGTFSKVMFPGLRIGYVIAPPRLMKAFVRAKWLADRQTAVLEQAVLADFLREGHLDRHIRRMRRLYGRRRAALVDALERHFGDRVQVLGDNAGMHVVVRFDDDGVAARAEANRVQIESSAMYYVGKAPRNEFVFGFSCLGERAIREGVRRLAG
jgi:GntR family transcriptional regulator / MocR family aminotransferase